MTVPASAVEVVTLGETMRLLVAEPGVALRRAQSFTSGLAGAESNVAVGLTRLGHRTRWISRVGADPSGQTILESLRGEGVDVSGVLVDPVLPTGLMLRDSHSHRAITVEYHRRGSAATALSAADVRRVGLGGARHVHLTGITAMLSPSALAAVTAVLDLADGAGTTVSIDPNLRLRLAPVVDWARTVGPLLSRADVVLAGEDELNQLFAESTADVAARMLGGRAQAVVTKNSDHSSTVRTAEGEWTVPSMVQRMVDPVGCGDAVSTGFLSYWLAGESPETALRAGVACAALVATAVGDTEGLPDRAELDAVLAADGRELVNR